MSLALSQKHLTYHIADLCPKGTDCCLVLMLERWWITIHLECLQPCQGATKHCLCCQIKPATLYVGNEGFIKYLLFWYSCIKRYCIEALILKFTEEWYCSACLCNKTIHHAAWNSPCQALADLYMYIHIHVNDLLHSQTEWRVMVRTVAGSVLTCAVQGTDLNLWWQCGVPPWCGFQIFRSFTAAP